MQVIQSESTLIRGLNEGEIDQVAGGPAPVVLFLTYAGIGVAGGLIGLGIASLVCRK